VPLRHAADGFRLRAGRVGLTLTPPAGAGWLRPEHRPRLDDRAATIAFTSGTEGEPKGVVLSHRNLADVVSRLNTVMQVDDSIREYVGVPVYHSFGFGRCRAVAAAGGAVYLPERFDPLEAARLAQAGEINAISAVPSLWRILLEHAERFRSAGARIRWIEIGSQSMSRIEKEQLKALFPNARIVQHYGLTEASRSTFLPIHEVDGQRLESVGRANGAVELAIDPASGCIRIRGPHVARQLIVDGQARPATDAEGWLVTQDLGSLDGPWLTYHGRADDMINCGGLKLSPDAIEAAIAQGVAGVPSFSVARLPDPLRGDAVLVAVEGLAPGDPLLGRIRSEAARAVRALGADAGDSIRVETVDALPRTASGKVQRKQLAQSIGPRSVIPAPEPADPDAPAGATPAVLRAFERVFPGRPVAPDDSFVTLGGDSLTSIRLALQLQHVLGSVPDRWQELPVARLQALAAARSGRPAFVRVETASVLRALAILLVVVNHFRIGPGYGGDYVLFAIAGFNFARFQIPAILSSDSVRPIASLARRLFLPSLLFILALQVHKGSFAAPTLLMVSNWIGPGYRDGEGLWFIEVLLQMLALVAVVLSISPVRRHLQMDRWRTSLALLAGSTLLLVVPNAIAPSHDLYGRLPHLLLWLFMFGWCTALADTRGRKAGIVVAAMLITPMLNWMLTDEPHAEPLGSYFDAAVACALLAYVATVSLPRWIAVLVQAVAGASMFIYITHMASLHRLERLLPLEPGLLHVALALLIGYALWLAWEAAGDRLAAIWRYRSR
jgi:hypothetical protein